MAITEVDCDIDEIVYQLRGAPQFTAGFETQIRQTSYASELVFWFKTPKQIYWFAFNSPNGYGGTFISPDVDPGRIRLMSEAERDADEDSRRLADSARGTEALSLDFDAFRPDLTVYEAPPQRSDRAPARLFARGLGLALWYNPTELSGGDGTAEQESMPIAMFEPASCGGAQLREPHKK